MLIAANLAAAFVLLWQPQLVDQFGFSATHPTLLTALTCLFLHQNLFHLLGNMLFLAAVGASVELATGRFRFTAVYFVSGLAGVLVHFFAVRHDPSATPLIGASGAIAGCAGYYAARYTRLRVPMGPRISASILFVSVLWLLLQVAGGLIRLGDSTGTVAYWAHIGGFVAGVLVSLVFRAPDLRQEMLDRQVLDVMSQRGPAAAAMAARRHLKRHPRDLASLRKLVDALQTLGETEELPDILLRELDLVPVEERADVIDRLVSVHGVDRMRSDRAMTLAGELRSMRPKTALALYQAVADGDDATQKPEALFAVAEMYAESDQAASHAACKRLIDEFAEHPAATRVRARGMLN